MKKAMKLFGAVVVGGSLVAGAAFAADTEPPFRKQRMEKFDTNKDGKLDETERAALRAQKQARHQEMVAKYDANKDGKLDDAERNVLREEKVKARFKALDTNNDGMLSIDEFKAASGKGGFGKHGRKGRHFGR